MLDIWLLNALLNAVKPHSRLVLVGDVNQLPSVGTGQTLHDIIESQAIPVTRLTRIYRQAQTQVSFKTHRINSASLPISSEQQDFEGLSKDFFIIDRESQEQSLHTLLHILQTKIPSLGYSPLKDVQVLTPMHGGILGTQNLNRSIQQLINPTGEDLTIGSKTFV